MLSGEILKDQEAVCVSGCAGVGRCWIGKIVYSVYFILLFGVSGDSVKL